MDISIEDGKTVENCVTPNRNVSHSKCALCKKKFEQESDLRLLIDNSSYGYGSHYSLFCFDCSAEGFPVEVLQACSLIEKRLHQSQDTVLKAAEIREIRDIFSVEKIALHRTAIISNYEQYDWTANWEPWIKPVKSVRIRGLAALKALAYIGGKDAIKKMVEGLSSGELNNRKFISEAMHEIQNPEFAKALKNAKGQDRSPEVNRNIAAAIEKYESLEEGQKNDELSKKSVKELKKILVETEEYGLVFLVLKRKSKDWVKDSLQILEDVSLHAKMLIIQHLSMEGNEIVTEALLKFKDHDHIGFRRQVRKILIDRGVELEEDETVKLTNFLENDDPSLRMMGLSMMQGLSSGNDFLGFVIGLNMFDSDKNVRAKAKSIFLKHASKDLKEKIKKVWKASYRTIKSKERNVVTFEKVLDGLRDSLFSLKDICHVAIKTENYAIAAVSNLHKTNENCLDIAIPLLGQGWPLDDAAVSSISQMGEIAVPALIESLKDENNRFVANAATTLGNISSPESVGPLIESLKHEGDFVRRRSTEALGNIGDKKAVEPITELIKDEDSYVREAAVNTLEELGWSPKTDEQKIDVLVAKKDWASISALGSGAVDRLISLLNDEGYGVGREAASCLGEIGDQRAVEPLITIIQNKTPDVVDNSITALGKIGDQRAFEALEQVIVEANDYQRPRYKMELALEALVLLNDERTFDVIVDRFVKATNEEDTEALKITLNLLGDSADPRSVKPIINWLDSGSLSKIALAYTRGSFYRFSSIIDSAGNALGKTGKSALKEILELLESDKYNRMVSVLALNLLECKPDNDDLMQLYLLTKDSMKSRDQTLIAPESYIEDCISIGKIDSLCRVLEEFEPFGAPQVGQLYEDYNNGKYYLRVAEALARIGDKRAVEPLKKAGLEVHILWLSGDVQGLLDIIGSDDDDFLSLLLRETAAKALGFIADEKAIDPLMDVLSRDSNRGQYGLQGGREPKKAIEKIKERQQNKLDLDDDSNINLLLESADDSKVIRGLDNAKEIDLSEEQKEIVLGIKLWNKDLEVRNKAEEILGSSNLLEETKKLSNLWKLKTLKSVGNNCEKLKALGINGAMPVHKLISYIEDYTYGNRKQRKEALELLGKFGNSQAVFPLVSGFSAGESRFETAIVLGKIGDSRAIKPLMEAFKGRYDSSATTVRSNDELNLRVAIAIALGMIGDSQATEALIEFGLSTKGRNTGYGDRNAANVRGYSAEALGIIGESSAVDSLLKVLGDSSSIDTLDMDKLTFSWSSMDGNTVSVKAIEALVKIGDQRAIEPLVNMLEHGDPVGKAGVSKPYWPCHEKKSLSWALEKLGWEPDTDERRALFLLNRSEHNVWNLTEDEFTSWGSSAIDPLCNLLKHKHVTVQRKAIETLGNIGDSRAIGPLTEVAETSDGYQVVQALQKLGSEAVPSLIEIAESGRDVSLHAIYSLSFIGDSRALKPLTIFLEHENEDIRKAAIGAFGDLHQKNVTIPEDVVEKLINLIPYESGVDKEIREEGIQAIGKIRPTKAVESLIGFLEVVIKDEEILKYGNPNYYSYPYAMIALGNIGDKRALDILLKILNKHDAENTIRDVNQVFYALGDLGDKRAIPNLLKILEKGPWEHQHHITRALEKLGHKVE